MEFQPTEFVRKSFAVKALEVTYENINDVAKWCKGRIESESTKVLGGNEVSLPVVKFPGQGEDRGKDLTARLGYFVVESKNRFRVYKAPQFWAAFEQKVVLEEPKEDSYLPGHLSDGSCCAGDPLEGDSAEELQENLDREVEEKTEATSQ